MKENGKHRMKILPPTQRKKHRYIKFQVLSESPITYSDLDSGVWNTFLDFYGEFGVSSMDMWLMKNLYDSKNQIGILRCEHDDVQAVIACMGMLKRLGDNRISIKILKVSGTIKGLENK